MFVKRQEIPEQNCKTNSGKGRVSEKQLKFASKKIEKVRGENLC